MNRLLAVRQAGRTAPPVVAGPDSTGLRQHSEPTFSVAVAGGEAALAIDPDLVVAVAGRIDALPGARAFRPAAPARDLLTAWRASGPSALAGAVGDFVAVCYDRRSTELSVFRDITGTVPAYVVDGERQVVTDSLRSALTWAEQVSIDWTWVTSYLAGAWPDLGRTPYAQISLVAPGWLATTTGPDWGSRPLDEWNWVDDVPEDLALSAERFRHLFDDAVRRRLGGERLTAITTSGGLDSSSVLMTARHLHPERPLVALALRFTDPRGDERDYQEAVARAAGASLVWLPVEDAAGPFGADLDSLFDEHAGPPGNGNWFLHDLARRRAQDLGVGRVLDGEDGDGVVGGHPVYLADLVGRGRAVEWMREVVALARARHVPVRSLMRRSLGRARLAYRAGELGRSYPVTVRGLVQGGYLSSVMAETYRQWSAVPGSVAHPFLDRRVVEYALSVPTPQRIRRGTSKVILRAAMGTRLPPSIATRRDKADLSDPFVTALIGPQRQALDEGLTLARAELSSVAGYAVPSVDDSSAPRLHAAYRAAVTAHWIRWIAQRGNSRRRAEERAEALPEAW